MQSNGHATLGDCVQPLSIQRHKKTERTRCSQKMQERHSGVELETWITAGKERNRGWVSHFELLIHTAAAQLEHTILEWRRIVTRTRYKTHYLKVAGIVSILLAWCQSKFEYGLWRRMANVGSTYYRTQFMNIFFVTVPAKCDSKLA